MPGISTASDSEFVELCYQLFLGRPSDGPGFEAHLEQLEAGMPRVEMMEKFLRCSEFTDRFKRIEENSWAPAGHFYSPIPSVQDVADRFALLNTGADACPDVDMRDAEQVKMLKSLGRHCREQPFHDEPDGSNRYYFKNDLFGYADALVTYGMLRHFRPKRVIEIGSGFSSAVMLDTNDRFLDGTVSFTFIEPFPDRLNSLLRASDRERVQVIERPVQSVPAAVFEQLECGDVLFIDSSHVGKCNSDVLYELFNILPILKPGVVVHIHDVFWPFEYPRAWLEQGRAWNELYLLRAFLNYNHDFDVLYANHYMFMLHSDLIEKHIPLAMKHGGASFWMQKKRQALAAATISVDVDESLSLPAAESNLPFTGERYVPTVEGEIELEHYHRYILAAELCRDKEVLDIACGEGYGAALIAQRASRVLGVDVDPETVRSAAAKYARANLSFLLGSCQLIPLADHSVDVVVSFETLEHVAEHDRFISEIRRVLRPNGMLIISTPDGEEYNTSRTEPNPFHLMELERDEFIQLLRRSFDHVQLAGQRNVYASAIVAENSSDSRLLCTHRTSNRHVALSGHLVQPMYLVAVCSRMPLPPIPSSLYEANITPNLRSELLGGIAERDREIVALRQAMAQQIEDIHSAIADSPASGDVMGAVAQGSREQPAPVASSHADHTKVTKASEILAIAGLRAQLLEAQSQFGGAVRTGIRHEETAQQIYRQLLSANALSFHRVLSLHARDRWRHRLEIQGLIAERRAEVYREAAREKVLAEGMVPTKRSFVRRNGRRYKEWRVIRNSPLFDADYYRSQVPESRLAQRSPAWHFVVHGDAAGLNPHPLFSTRYYQRQVAELRRDGRNSLVHFLMGGHATHSPHPLFDVSFYRQHSPDIAASGVNPLLHYLSHGGAEDRATCYLFDSRYYRAGNSDVATFKGTPLEHYVTVGWKRGARPHPLFDPDYYARQRADDGDLFQSPLEHFVALGSRLYLSPHPLFDPEYYISTYADLRDYREPFLHLLRHGLAERRKPHPLFETQYYVDNHPAAGEPQVNPLVHYLTSDMRTARTSPVFDAGFYVDSNPEAGRPGASPLIHYLNSRSGSSARPHPLFDPDYYMSAQPAARGGRDTPLVHWLTAGHLEAAGASAVFDSRHYCDQEPGLDRLRVDPLVYAAQHPGETSRHFNVGRVQPLALHVAQTLESTRQFGTMAERALHVALPAPSGEPMVSIVIPFYNHVDHTLRCLKAIQTNTTGENYEVIVIDDCSTDADAAVLRTIPGVRYIRNETNMGFLRTSNKAAAVARGTYVVMLNNDTAPMPGWLTQLRQTFERYPDAGLVGSMLLYPDGRLQEAGGIIWADGRGWNFGRLQSPEHPDYNYVRDVSYCSGAAIMLPRELWESLGGFDELYQPAYYEDSDLAFRVRQAGRRVLYQPFSRVIHFEGVSSGTDTGTGVKRHQAINQPKFYSRWGHTLESYGNDPDPRRDFINRTNIGQVLVIDSCTPTPDKDSGSADTFNLIRILRSLGYGVTFLPIDNYLHFGTYTEALQQLGVECLYQPFVQSLEQFLTEQGARYDAVLLYRVTNADPYLDMVGRLAPRAKIIFDTVDLHFVRQQREAELNRSAVGLQRAELTREQELSAMSRADATVVVSERELQLVEQLLPDVRAYHLPILRDVPGRGRAFADRSDVVFIGGFQHTPNVDAVRWLVNEIWPLVVPRLPGVKLQIVGSHAPAEITAMAGSNVVVRGFVPELAEVFDHCRISVAPLRYGAGAKGKVVTTLSYGVPAVVTSIAAEGMGLTHDHHAMVADDPAAFAEGIVQLYTDESRWNRLSDQGVSLIKEQFSIEAVRERLIVLLRDLDLPVPGAK